MRWDNIGTRTKCTKVILEVYSNSTSPKKTWCLQAFSVNVLGGQLDFNGNIGYASHV